ncbi:hypothetical protein [Pseudoduganella namucuonensis]|uniref:Uncharacterized protein n=1 Tax=Pseudoduganella namucuonensis TaxID=1035707 RepID=A0A1I7M0Z3_9BURK|nr:hypothetical protein [Pseudoduganella namucuonensis]SFV15595.1 hypothetical protein SAMN05216552_10472 [Pseudoduganella namucuonensis]
MNTSLTSIAIRSFDAAAEVPGITSIERILANPAVSRLGSKDDGSFSDKQLLLATTVVSVMQDDIAMELAKHRQTLINELQFQRSAFVDLSRSAAIGIMNFARTGMFTVPKNDTDDKRPLLLRVFTWGNFFAGSAIVLVAIAGFTTHTYLAFKELAEVREKELNVQKGIVAEQADNLTKEKNANQAKSEALTRSAQSLAEMTAQVTVLKSKLEVKVEKEETELQRQLVDAQIKAANAIANADKQKASQSYQKDQIALLRQTVADKEERISALEKETKDKSKAIESLTEKLDKRR